jgi:PAS domain S-box-containing protein
MKFINQLPIKVKLILIALAVSLPVLILFAAYTLLGNIEASKDRLKSEIENVTKMTNEYARPFLLFEDKTPTEQLLQTFQKFESIDYACYYGTDGEVFSEYQELPKEIQAQIDTTNSSEYIGDYLYTFANATYEGERVGTLFILSNTSKVQKLINQSIQDTLLAILVAVLIAFGLVLILQRFISEPILNLANFTKTFTDSPDYGQRIDNVYQDEVGTLYNSFNSMLDAIESTTVSRGYLNDILSSMAEMLIVLDNDFIIQKINDAVIDQTGYSSRELIGRKIDILLKKMTNEAFYEQNHIETNLYTKDGTRKIVSISLSGLHSDGGQNSSNIICTARDITEQQLAKEQLKKNFEELQNTQAQLKVAKELAEASSKAKSEFLSKMSHEIRTPMNAIMGMAHLLLRNNPEEEQRKDLEDLLISTESLLTLINDILDFSQIETGQVIFQNREFDIHQLVSNVVRAHEQDNIEMEVNIDDRIPKIVKGDEKRFAQILTNLTQNAVKFTEAGTVYIDAKLNSFDSKQVFIEFSVRDTGIGIPEDKLDLIFESFSQVDNSLTRKYQGKGLGLSIVKHLLELQGSAIQVESIVNKGSTFSFILGFENVEVTQKKAITNGQKPVIQITNPAEQRFDGLKVLLVEDNRMNIVVTKKLLKTWNVEVEVALNGKIGVEKATESDYDLILMDLQMPVMDGFEATSNIRTIEKHKDTPIIALTAEVMEESQARAIEVGMNDFVTKPFKPNVLFQAMSQFVVVSN